MWVEPAFFSGFDCFCLSLLSLPSVLFCLLFYFSYFFFDKTLCSLQWGKEREKVQEECFIPASRSWINDPIVPWRAKQHGLPESLTLPAGPQEHHQMGWEPAQALAPVHLLLHTSLPAAWFAPSKASEERILRLVSKASQHVSIFLTG